MYRVSWKSLITGIISHGDWHDSRELIKDWVEWGNKEYKNEIKHWIESN